VSVPPTVSISGPSSVALAAPNTPGAVNTIQLTATGNPTDGTSTYSWMANNGNVTLTNDTTQTVTVQAASAGGTQISLTYTNNGVSVTANHPVVIQQPAATSLTRDTGNTTYACTLDNGSFAYNGVTRSVEYQVLDNNNSQRILIDGIPMVESFSSISNSCSKPDTPDVGNGPTYSGGKFGDLFRMCDAVCYPADPNYNPNGCARKVNHTWTANGFPVFNSVLTYTCTSITP
jgi:hypothetical protein